MHCLKIYMVISKLCPILSVPVTDLYWLDQIQPEQHPLVGDSALYLSTLVQRGYPVVPGCVISAETFRNFLATVNWLEPLFEDLATSSLYLNVENPRQLQVIARQIRQTIETAPLPTDWIAELAQAVERLTHWGGAPSGKQAVILRPSLTLRQSAASIQSSPLIDPEVLGLLDCQVCWVEPDALANGLKQTWAELFRARNLLYWQRAHIPLHQINLAVLVQPLNSAVASGCLHIHHGIVELQAVRGLGATIAPGQTLPACYQMDVKTGAVSGQELPHQVLAYRVNDQCLSALPPLTLPAWEGVDPASPVQPYLLSDQQASQPVLGDLQFEQLVQLAQQLVTEFKGAISLEWMLYEVAENQVQFYLTQVIPYLSGLPPVSLEAMPLRSLTDPSGLPLQPAMVSGLAASPGQVVAQATVINTAHPPAALRPGTILVAPNFTPDWLPLLKFVAGVVADQGGMTSHGAIIARELGIPAVVGASGATQQIVTGDWLRIDGNQGRVYRTTAAELDQLTQATANLGESAPPTPSLLAPNRAATHTPQLMVSLSQPAVIAKAANLPVDGIGLLRSELMVLGILDQQHPTQWLRTGRRDELVDRWASQLSQFAVAFSPRPVFYRSLDLRSHEFRTLRGGEQPLETNPTLGVRGTFSYQLHPDLFQVELDALSAVIQSGYPNLRLLLPFVRTVEEFTFCRQRVEAAGLTQFPGFELWIMAEVPSVLFLLADYVAAGVEGIAIGTNDLTQLLLGVDRDQAVMATAFDEAHPAVLRAIAQLIQTAHTLGIPCSICGQLPVHHPELIEQFMQWGVTSLSVSVDAVTSTLQAMTQALNRD
jgi:pyruvate, water dikinase